MSALHAAALLQVYAACAAYAVFLHGYGMPAALAALATLGAAMRIRAGVPWVLRRVLALGISLGFLAWWRLALAGAPPMYKDMAFGNNFAYAFGLHFVGIQALQFYMRHPNGLPLHMPLLGMGAMLLAGDFFPRSDGQRAAYLGFALAFAACTALYFAWCHGVERHRSKYRMGLRRRLIGGMALAASVLLAAGAAAGLDALDRAITAWVLGAPDLSPHETLGAARSISLQGVQIARRHDPNAVALRVFSAQPPPYLRSHVYGSYVPMRWIESRNAHPAGPVQAPPALGVPGAFRVRRTNHAPAQSLEVWPDPAIKTAMFLPLGAEWIVIDAPRLDIDDEGTAAAQDARGAPYRVHYDDPPHPPISARTPPADFAALPPELEGIAALAARVTEGAGTPRAKAAAICAYLQGRNGYALGERTPEGVDPIAHFLFAEPPPPGHCEYFASAAVLLLRAAGVPARYVTGAAPWERARYGNYYIVRNRDAHAWAEAYDRDRGWFTVEPTPPAGRPDGGAPAAGPWPDAWAHAALLLRQAFAYAMAGDRRSLAWLIYDLLDQTASFAARAWWLWLPALAAALYAAACRWARRVRPQRLYAPPRGAAARAAHRNLLRMDRRMRRRHLVRAPHETLHQFADRIEAQDGAARAAAAWYRGYACARYGGGSMPPLPAA